MRNFKKRLELFKKENGLQGKDLADAGEISPQSVSAYSDTSLPRAEVLAGWAKKLNLNINWLLTGEGGMFHSESTLPAISAPERTEDMASMREKLYLLQEKYTAVLEELYELRKATADANFEAVPVLGTGSVAPSNHDETE